MMVEGGNAEMRNKTKKAHIQSEKSLIADSEDKDGNKNEEVCVLSAFSLGATAGCVERRELAPGPAEEALTVGSDADASAEDVPTPNAEEWTKDATEIRQMVEFLVRRERKLDVKTYVAVRRLERLEKKATSCKTRTGPKS